MITLDEGINLLVAVISSFALLAFFVGLTIAFFGKRF